MRAGNGRYRFSIPLTVRVGDLNYGNHVGYQHYFSYFQEARVAYLKQFGFSEMDIGGSGMIISTAECRYKKELLLGDEITVWCRVNQIRRKAFIMEYRIERDREICGEGTTTNFCFDYERRRPVALPDSFVEQITGYENL